MRYSIGFIGCLTMLLLVAACTQIHYICPTGDHVMDPSHCPLPSGEEVNGQESVTEVIISETEEVEPEEETVETVAEEAEVIEPEVDTTPVVLDEETAFAEDLRAKFAAKIRSYSFEYKAPEYATVHYRYYVKGDGLRIDALYDDERIENQIIDTIYYDPSTGEAFAYCERLGLLKCRSKDVEVPVDIDDYMIFFPHEWLHLIESAKELGSEMIHQSKAIRMEADFGDGKPVLMWVDSYSGLPLRIEDGKDLYEFERYIYNGVRDSQMQHIPNR